MSLNDKQVGQKDFLANLFVSNLILFGQSGIFRRQDFFNPEGPISTDLKRFSAPQENDLRAAWRHSPAGSAS
jgi:hypothetical protein